MKCKILSVLVLFLILGKCSIAQTLVGDWKGTSLCQVKNSPCHDETVVYHISKESGSNAYLVNASKIIDGKEDDMGPIHLTFDPNKNILFLADSANQRKWEFKVTGYTMHGDLFSKGVLFRIIELKKQASF